MLVQRFKQLSPWLVRPCVALAVVAALLVVATPCLAQFKLPENFGSGFGRIGQSAPGEQVTATAQFTAATADRPAVLMVTAQIAPGWHMYSTTQPAGGPQKTQIELSPSDQYRVLGPFQPNKSYDAHIDDVAWIGLELQEHSGEVTWYAPIELAEGVDASKLQVSGKLVGQVCQESCIPVNAEWTATLGRGVPIGALVYYEQNVEPSDADATTAVASASRGFQLSDSVVSIEGRVYPAAVSPGSSARLEIVLTPPADWHVYARADDVPAVGPRPTLIEFDPSVTLRPEAPKTSQPVIEVDQSDIGWDAAHIHDGQVRWTSEIRVPEDVKAGRYVLSGVIGYQACDTADGTCEIPKGVRFEVPVEVSDRITSLSTQLNFAAAQYNDAKALAAASDSLPIAASGPVSATAEYDLESVVIGADAADRSILHYVVLAFVGGIILNLMPCVLPVIGLKVMSFVEQAGHSRSHALALNLWYSAGIVAVFLVLAGLAISLGFSWGGQFSSTAFNVTLAALVFAMALSLLGVWEIPIPGFLGSGSAQSMAAKEGPTGAFLKGVITTVLATPCTGPFMATALGWAVRQTPATTLTVFASMGLGMASPYLLIGAFPSLVRHLPKPGAWMETFKQLMGFVLLGTVVFLFSFMDPAAIVPTVALLVGVGIACWTMSRTPLTAEFKERLEAWLMAGAVTLLASVFAFGWLYPKVTQPRLEARVAAAAREMGGGQLVSDEPWQPFSLAALQRVAVEQGRTVLVDFSAEWCLTCKALENTVLHTDAVDKAIDDSEVVTMYGDFTDYPEEIDRTIKALGSNGVPVIAIFPGDDPYHPIVFRGAYTQGGLLAAIEEATTSRDARSAERVARKQ